MKQKFKRATRIVGGSLLWTIVLAAILFIADRGIFGPVHKPGWLIAASLSDVPAAAGRVKPPAYLPHPLLWPPNRIFYRVEPQPGWWVEVSPLSAEKDPTRVWLGSGAAPGPKELGPLQECIRRDGLCPDGWHLLSTRVKDARPGQPDVIYMISNIDPLQAARILEGLRL